MTLRVHVVQEFLRTAAISTKAAAAHSNCLRLCAWDHRDAQSEVSQCGGGGGLLEVSGNQGKSSKFELVRLETYGVTDVACGEAVWHFCPVSLTPRWKSVFKRLEMTTPSLFMQPHYHIGKCLPGRPESPLQMLLNFHIHGWASQTSRRSCVSPAHACTRRELFINLSYMRTCPINTSDSDTQLREDNLFQCLFAFAHTHTFHNLWQVRNWATPPGRKCMQNQTSAITHLDAHTWGCVYAVREGTTIHSGCHRTSATG